MMGDIWKTREQEYWSCWLVSVLSDIYHAVWLDEKGGEGAVKGLFGMRLAFIKHEGHM